MSPIGWVISGAMVLLLLAAWRFRNTRIPRWICVPLCGLSVALWAVNPERADILWWHWVLMGMGVIVLLLVLGACVATGVVRTEEMDDDTTGD